MRLRGVIILIFILGTLMLCVKVTGASWLIDGKRFHISAHGQTACTECHEEIPNQEFHPNPSDVNKRLSDFFDSDTCLSCHDDVTDNLDEGVHGTKKIEDPKKYETCIGCHNPHYQQRLGDNRMGQFDPAKPPHEQCGACHKEQTVLPAFSQGDEACVACHLLVGSKDPAGKQKILRFCFHCHAQAGTKTQELTGRFVPLINVKEYQSTPHAGIACTICHPSAAGFHHADQKQGDCRQCHLPHDEKVAHDAHLRVACEACHLSGIKPIRHSKTKHVVWKREPKLKEISTIHHMVSSDDEALCRRCHFKANEVGAVSLILPAKGIICMPCHTATFSIGDATTFLSLAFFLFGLVTLCSVWLSGTVDEHKEGSIGFKVGRLMKRLVWTLFSLKVFLIFKALMLDVLLQRRLYRKSGVRWLIHSMIFFPFLFRFLWGLITLFYSLWLPESPTGSVMLDKNNPITAFFFDITGLTIFTGIVIAFIRGFVKGPSQFSDLPKQDRLALSLIGSIVMIGFILEGIRVAMTGYPEGSQHAFIGYWISMLFSNPSGLTEVYGYIWYIHAILTGAFVVYLPFSQLFHIIMGPVVLSINAVSEHGRR